MIDNLEKQKLILSSMLKRIEYLLVPTKNLSVIKYIGLLSLIFLFSKISEVNIYIYIYHEDIPKDNKRLTKSLPPLLSNHLKFNKH